MNEKEEVLLRHVQNRRGETIKEVPITVDRETANNVVNGNQEKVTVNIIHQTIDTETAKESMDEAKTKNTAGSLKTAEIKAGFSETAEVNEKRILEKAARWDRNAKALGVAAIGVVGVATLLDIGNGLSEKKEVARMLKEQEQQLEKRQIAERKSLRRDSYDYVDMGQIVTEMFNERIGHYKMGNAKFNS